MKTIELINWWKVSKPMMNPFLIILLLLSVQSIVLGVEYGPSLSSLTGVFVNWKGPDLLNIESGRRVKLENYPGYAAVIPLVTGDSKGTSEKIFQERGISTLGEFMVEAPKGFGIMAVIQELKLRKSTRDRANNSTCSDYIQFGEYRSEGGGGIVTSKICGIINRDDSSLKPEGLLGPRAFKSPSGRLRMAFNHAYVAELVDSLLGSRQKPITLRVEVVFTAYKTAIDCSSESNASTGSGIKGDEDSYEPCTDYFSVNQTCISSKLICDEVFNCGGENDTLGSDDSVITCPDKPARTTEKPLEEEMLNDRSESYGSIPAYNFGAPSLSSFTPRKYERKFRPYVSSSSQLGSSSGGSFSFDINSRRGYSSSPAPPSSTEIKSESVVSSGDSKASQDSLNANRVANQNHENSIHLETEIYNRRELSHAINSVIYGVAFFIIFTIFITVFVVCITKKIQMTWSARSESRHNSVGQGTLATIPSVVPSTTTTVITHNTLCAPSPQNNTTVVVLQMPPSLESSDPPPAYDSLFPIPIDSSSNSSQLE